MGNDFQQSATYQALVHCLVRHLRKRRAEVLDRVETSGCIKESEWAESLELERLDHALTEFGDFDVRDPASGEGRSDD